MVRDRLAREKKLSDPIVADLKAALTEFKQFYRPLTPRAAPARAKSGPPDDLPSHCRCRVHVTHWLAGPTSLVRFACDPTRA